MPKRIGDTPEGFPLFAESERERLQARRRQGRTVAGFAVTGPFEHRDILPRGPARTDPRRAKLLRVTLSLTLDEFEALEALTVEAEYKSLTMWLGDYLRTAVIPLGAELVAKQAAKVSARTLLQTAQDMEADLAKRRAMLTERR